MLPLSKQDFLNFVEYHQSNFYLNTIFPFLNLAQKDTSASELYSELYHHDKSPLEDQVLVYYTVNNDFLITFQLPTMVYTKEQLVFNCGGKTDCKAVHSNRNCIGCYGDRNLQSSFRKSYPIYPVLKGSQLLVISKKDILNIQMEYLGSEENIEQVYDDFILEEKRQKISYLKRQNRYLMNLVEKNMEEINAIKSDY